MCCTRMGALPQRSGLVPCHWQESGCGKRHAISTLSAQRSGLRPGTVLSFNPSSSGSHSTVLVKRVRLFPLVQLAIAQSLTSPRNLRQMYINRTTRKDSGNYRKGSNRGMVICNGDAAVAIAFCSCSFLFAFCALCQ